MQFLMIRTSSNPADEVNFILWADIKKVEIMNREYKAECKFYKNYMLTVALMGLTI